MTDQVQDKFITLNNFRFHYRDWENQDAPILILLHGVTGHARRWDTVARAMQDRFRILALDQRGHGETDWAKIYSWELMLEDLNAFVRALGLKRISLIGHSMGGRNSYTFTSKYPEMVERLVIVDIGPEVMPAFLAGLRTTQIDAVFNEPEELFLQMRMTNPRPSDAELRHYVVNSIKRREDGKWTFRYDTAIRTIPGFESFDSQAQWSLLPRIICPTLLIRGAETKVLARETAERMTREIPNCRYVEIPNSGHIVPLDNPPEFIAAVREFL